MSKLAEDHTNPLRVGAREGERTPHELGADTGPPPSVPELELTEAVLLRHEADLEQILLQACKQKADLHGGRAEWRQDICYLAGGHGDVATHYFLEYINNNSAVGQIVEVRDFEERLRPVFGFRIQLGCICACSWHPGLTATAVAEQALFRLIRRTGYGRKFAVLAKRVAELDSLSHGSFDVGINILVGTSVTCDTSAADLFSDTSTVELLFIKQVGGRNRRLGTQGHNSEDPQASEQRMMGNLLSCLPGCGNPTPDPKLDNSPRPGSLPEIKLPAPIASQREKDIAFIINNIITAVCVLNNSYVRDATVHETIALKHKAIEELVILFGETWMTLGETASTVAQKERGKFAIKREVIQFAVAGGAGLPVSLAAVASYVGELAPQEIEISSSRLKGRAATTRLSYHKADGDDRMIILFEDIDVRSSARQMTFGFGAMAGEQYSLSAEHVSIYISESRCSPEDFSKLKGMLDILRIDILKAAYERGEGCGLGRSGVSLAGSITGRIKRYPLAMDDEQKRDLVKTYVENIGATHLPIASLARPECVIGHPMGVTDAVAEDSAAEVGAPPTQRRVQSKVGNPK